MDATLPTIPSFPKYPHLTGCSPYLKSVSSSRSVDNSVGSR
jgi:hypothetical protein